MNKLAEIIGGALGISLIGYVWLSGNAFYLLEPKGLLSLIMGQSPSFYSERGGDHVANYTSTNMGTYDHTCVEA
jgi:hypothetical protein